MAEIPDVTLNELQNALGIVPAGADEIMVVIGCSSKGPLNTPATYGDPTSLVADFGYGPMVEEAALSLNDGGTAVTVIRTPSTVAGAAGTTITSGVTGTAAAHAAIGGAALDAFDVKVLIITGGTLGTTGITFQWSLDAVGNMSPTTALGTALTYTIPNSGVVITFGLSTETLAAGDVFFAPTTEPKWASADLTAAFAALSAGSQAFGFVQIAGPVSASEAATIATALDGLRSSHKGTWCLVGARGPNVAESESTWIAALESDYAATFRTDLPVCAGTWRVTSPISGRVYNRRITGAVGARFVRIPVHIDAAKVALGPLTGGTLFDSNKNLKGHDERVRPGLTAANFITLRTFTITGQAAYITNPCLMSAPGSDFDLVQKRRVMNVVERVLYFFSVTLDLSAEGTVDPETGFISETAARDIEIDIREALKTALGPAISNPDDPALFILSRTDPVLTNGGKLTGSSRVTPLFYIKGLTISVGFKNA